VFAEVPDEVLQDPGTLPPHDCRIVFRDVVRATDRRTMKSCLAPPRVFAIHDAPQLIWPRGTDRDLLYVLGIFNSVCFDWLLRRVGHVTFGTSTGHRCRRRRRRRRASPSSRAGSRVDDHCRPHAAPASVGAGWRTNDSEFEASALVTPRTA
jgi:hypothetical protein